MEQYACFPMGPRLFEKASHEVACLSASVPDTGAFLPLACQEESQIFIVHKSTTIHANDYVASRSLYPTQTHRRIAFHVSSP